MGKDHSTQLTALYLENSVTQQRQSQNSQEVTIFFFFFLSLSLKRLKPITMSFLKKTSKVIPITH